MLASVVHSVLTPVPRVTLDRLFAELVAPVRD
jgi:hypothetical protein